MPIDNESPPGSWARELAARPRALRPQKVEVFDCRGCGWSGTEPSITDASSAVERNGRLEVDRTHLAVCPLCFEVLKLRNTSSCR